MTTLIIHPEVDSKDTRELTPAQARQVVRAMKRIARGETSLEDVCELRNAPGYFRWKPSRDMRLQADCEVRAVYHFTSKGDLELVAACDRRDVYSIAFSRIQAKA